MEGMFQMWWTDEQKCEDRAWARILNKFRMLAKISGAVFCENRLNRQ